MSGSARICMTSGAPYTSSHTLPTCRDSIRQAAGNLPWVDVIPSEGLNVYSILQRDQLLMTAQAVHLLTQRVQQPIKR